MSDDGWARHDLCVCVCVCHVCVQYGVDEVRLRTVNHSAIVSKSETTYLTYSLCCICCVCVFG